MRKKKVLNIVLGSVAALLVAWFVYTQFLRKPPVFITIQKEGVIEETLYREVSATGTINPIEMVDVGTQVSGKISEVRVDFNDQVKKGQVLARMDTRILKSTMRESRANVDKAEITLEQTKRELERQKQFVESGVSPKVELEKAQDAYNNAVATLHIAKLQLQKNSINLGFAEIVSPINGVVISRNVEVGQTVAASFSTPTLFTIANDLKEMKIEASIDEADIGQVKQYQKVVFTVDSYPEEDFSGVVAQVQLKPTVVQNVVTYNVIVLIENPEMKLMPGMTATLIIQTEERPNSLSVPNSALAFDPNEKDWKQLKKKKYNLTSLPEEKENTIWLVKGKTLQEVAVEIDFTNGIRTAIQGNISTADTVVTNLKIQVGEKVSGSLFMPDDNKDE